MGCKWCCSSNNSISYERVVVGEEPVQRRDENQRGQHHAVNTDSEFIGTATNTESHFELSLSTNRDYLAVIVEEESNKGDDVIFTANLSDGMLMRIHSMFLNLHICHCP